MTLPTTPSLEAARIEIATAIKTAADAWLAVGGYTLIVESENRTQVDLASTEAQKPFLTWEIKFRGGGQSSLGNSPTARSLGQIVLSSKVKEGAGLAGSLKLLDHLIPYLEMKKFTLVRTHAAETYDGVARQGWYFVPVVINFWFHRVIPT